jgi:hypothetical protein
MVTHRHLKPLPPQERHVTWIWLVRFLPPAPPHAEQGTHTLPDFLPPAPPHRPQVSNLRTCSVLLPAPPHEPHTRLC